MRLCRRVPLSVIEMSLTRILLFLYVMDSACVEDMLQFSDLSPVPQLGDDLIDQILEDSASSLLTLVCEKAPWRHHKGMLTSRICAEMISSTDREV